MNNSHSEAWFSNLFTLTGFHFSGLGTMTQSKNQVDNITWHAVYVGITVYKIHFITWKSTLFDAYINHEVFENANDDDDDKTASFTLILFNFQSYWITCVLACVSVFILIIRIKAFSIFPTSRSIGICRESRQKRVKRGRFIKHIEIEQERDQEHCQSIQLFIMWVFFIYFVCPLLNYFVMKFFFFLFRSNCS